MSNQYRKLPYQGGSPREISEVVNNCVEGKLNSTGSFTVSAGTTTTNVTDKRAGANSIILFTGLGDDITHTHPYVSSRASGSFVVGHQNHGHDVTVGYVIIG
jgi:hypothetical protein